MDFENYYIIMDIIVSVIVIEIYIEMFIDTYFIELVKNYLFQYFHRRSVCCY